MPAAENQELSEKANTEVMLFEEGTWPLANFFGWWIEKNCDGALIDDLIKRNYIAQNKLYVTDRCANPFLKNASGQSDPHDLTSDDLPTHYAIRDLQIKISPPPYKLSNFIHDIRQFFYTINNPDEFAKKFTQDDSSATEKKFFRLIHWYLSGVREAFACLPKTIELCAFKCSLLRGMEADLKSKSEKTQKIFKDRKDKGCGPVILPTTAEALMATHSTMANGAKISSREERFNDMRSAIKDGKVDVEQLSRNKTLAELFKHMLELIVSGAKMRGKGAKLSCMGGPRVFSSEISKRVLTYRDMPSNMPMDTVRAVVSTLDSILQGITSTQKILFVDGCMGFHGRLAGALEHALVQKKSTNYIGCDPNLRGSYSLESIKPEGLHGTEATGFLKKNSQYKTDGSSFYFFHSVFTIVQQGLSAYDEKLLDENVSLTLKSGPNGEDYPVLEIEHPTFSCKVHGCGVEHEGFWEDVDQYSKEESSSFFFTSPPYPHNKIPKNKKGTPTPCKLVEAYTGGAQLGGDKFTLDDYNRWLKEIFEHAEKAKLQVCCINLSKTLPEHTKTFLKEIIQCNSERMALGCVGTPPSEESIYFKINSRIYSPSLITQLRTRLHDMRPGDGSTPATISVKHGRPGLSTDPVHSGVPMDTSSLYMAGASDQVAPFPRSVTDGRPGASTDPVHSSISIDISDPAIAGARDKIVPSPISVTDRQPGLSTNPVSFSVPMDIGLDALATAAEEDARKIAAENLLYLRTRIKRPNLSHQKTKTSDTPNKNGKRSIYDDTEKTRQRQKL